jgi:hypothetical protein
MLFSPHASVSMLFLCACEWRLLAFQDFGSAFDSSWASAVIYHKRPTNPNQNNQNNKPTSARRLESERALLCCGLAVITST